MDNAESSEISEQKQGVAGVFIRAASTYDRVGPRFFSHFGRRLVELAQIPSGSSVLDIATGRGAVLFPADYVLCSFAIFFFPQLDRALSEMRRVLKTGARIVSSNLGPER